VGSPFGARCLRLATVLLALSSVASAPPSEVLSPIYQAVVRRYASGDREGAVAELSAWPDSRIRREVPILNRDWQRSLLLGDAMNPDVWREIPVRAALMLHTDCAQRARGDGRPPGLHETAAWSIARTLKEHPAHRVFARRWYETYAQLAQAEYRWGEALDWAERGLREFPDSAEMLLVVGSIEETLGAQTALGLPPESLLAPTPRETQANRDLLREARAHLETARRSLRSAVAADPTLAEARLRLGRVASRLGDTAEALSALEEVLAREPPAGTAFLAHLFLGRLDEVAGRLREAMRSYEAALALDARSQSARLALSHVRLRLGDAALARADVEMALGEAGRRPQPDAYWLYPWGPSVGADGRLEALRREAGP
jgi:hypothetical protein